MQELEEADNMKLQQRGVGLDELVQKVALLVDDEVKEDSAAFSVAARSKRGAKLQVMLKMEMESAQ